MNSGFQALPSGVWSGLLAVFEVDRESDFQGVESDLQAGDGEVLLKTRYRHGPSMRSRMDDAKSYTR